MYLDAHDSLGRERLCRYLTRPAFALSRLRMRRDGNVSYRVKKVSRGRATERVMSPVEALGRLAAIVPPPRVVPAPPFDEPTCKASRPTTVPPELVPGSVTVATPRPPPPRS